VTAESLVTLVRAHLAKEGLVICKANDTQFPLDGLKEHQALRGLVELVEDARDLAEWDEADVTTPIGEDLLAALVRTAA
jgi:hypothetical protein